MAHAFKDGDRVQVVDREANAADVKSSLFYNHYRGLVGTVQKVFEASDEIAVTIDEDSLPEPICTRHLDIRQAMKSKWLDGLSEEARNRLSEQEKDFTLRYSILVSPTDLIPLDSSISPAKPAGQIESAADGSDEASPRRKTAAEIEAAEEEYLRSRKSENV